MKKTILALLVLLGTVGCSDSRTTEATVRAIDGRNGHSLVSQYMAATELECDAEGGARLDIYMDLDDSLTSSDGDLYQNSIIVCNGKNGLDGAAGQDGTDGQDGQDGTNGNNGENGHDGIAGPPGQAGPPGLNGNPGHDGSPGPQGPPGSPGAPGQNGHDGSNGSNGQDAHVTPKNVTGNCSNISTGYDAKIKDNTVELYTAGFSCSSPKKVYTLTSSASTFWLSATELAVFVDPAGLRILTYGN